MKFEVILFPEAQIYIFIVHCTKNSFISFLCALAETRFPNGHVNEPNASKCCVVRSLMTKYVNH